MNITAIDNLQTFETRLLKACPKEQLEKLARDHGFCQRTARKIFPLAFVYGLCRGTLHSFSSANIIAGTIAAITGKLVSKQALLKRFNQSAVIFLQQLLKAVVAYPLQISPQQIDQLFDAFANVWIVDSTTVKLHPSLVNFFPGSRNQSQKQSAILRIQLAYNLKSGLLYGISLSPFTRNDQKASADIFNFAGKDDLVLRDLGYFSTDVFAKMLARGISFITRIPASVNLFHLDLSPANLLKTLKDNDGIFDQDLIVSSKEKLRLRVVAIPLPPEEAKQRRRKAQNDRHQRANHSPEYFELLGWGIFTTNVPNSILSTKMIYSIYSIRWKIEIIFKIWKSFFLLVKVPDKSVFYLECVIYAKLILVVLANHSHIILSNSVYQHTRRRLSPMKLAQFMAHSMFQFFEPINTKKWTFTPIQFISYYCSYEKRKRKNMAEWIAQLTPVDELR